MTPDARAALLESLAAGVAIDSARKAAGVTPTELRRAREADPELAAACERAEMRRPFALLEREALALAIREHGTEEAVRKARPGLTLAALREMCARDTALRDAVLGAITERTKTETAAPQALPEAQPKKRRTMAVDEHEGPDWALIANEAAEYGPGLYGYLLRQEDYLVEAGFHGLSDWFRWTFNGFLDSPLRWLLILIGRGAGKSTSLTRLVALLMLVAKRTAPRGQTWVWPFLSIRPDDADRRLQEISEAFLYGYGIPTKPGKDGTIGIVDRHGHALNVISKAGTIGNVRGANAVGMTFDEFEFMGTVNVHSPRRIIAAAIDMLRGRSTARGIMSSSPSDITGPLYCAAREGHSFTNFVATIGAQFLDDAVAGFLEAALWEEQQKRNPIGADAMRAHARSLTADSPLVPTWAAHPRYAQVADPTAPPTAAASAVLMRIEKEAVPPDPKDAHLERWQIFMRENGCVPEGYGGDEDADIGDAAPFEFGDVSRYDGFTSEDRGYR